MIEEDSEQLVEWLLGTSSLSPAELCRHFVNRAAERMQETREPDIKDLTRDVRTARLFLSLVRESQDVEGLGSVATDLLQKVCIPYLNVLLDNCLTGPVVQELAETAAVALLSPHLPPSAVEETLRESLSPLLTSGDSAERLAILNSFLCHLFSRAKPENLETLPGVSEQLSAIFLLLLSLLDHASTATSHLILSSLLPLFITPSHPLRLSAVWSLVQEVWSGRRIIEQTPLAFLLSLLCCFSDVLISRDHTSPFLSVFPSLVTNLCPLLDVRREGVFWEVLWAGLRSSDPLDRKRAVYLLPRLGISPQSLNEV